MTSRDVLVVFARYPAAGEVKTRLARDIGDRAAADVYRAFLEDLAARFAPAPFAVRWAVAPPDRGLSGLLGVAPSSCFPQSGADLGDRMRGALRHLLVDEAHERCAIVGSDMPQLTLETIAEAFAALDRGADLVLGPAEDGGYYLIAMRAAHEVFAGIEWGSSRVLAQTRARAAGLGLRVHELALGFDVDRAADLARLRALLRAEDAATAMPATAKAIARIRGDAPDR